jgi:ribonuclease BN (tRNA processing enzyme)
MCLMDRTTDEGAAGSGSIGMGSVSVRVLGSCGAWPEPGLACSSYLVEVDGYRVVLDLGFGAYSRLAKAVVQVTRDIDALVLTHAHPDHLADVHALYRAVKYTDRPDRSRPLLLANLDVMRTLQAIDPDDAALHDTFEYQPLPGIHEVGPWTIRGVPTPHYVDNCSIRLDGPGVAVVYTGDCGPSHNLDDLTVGCDLLLCEATDRGQQNPATASDGFLMTGGDAGRLAARAGAGQLVLTHFWPGNDRRRTLAEAAHHFGGVVHIADESGPGFTV